MDDLHSLLDRQIRRALKNGKDLLKDIPDFIAQVDAAYKQFDADRAMLERSMEVSSEELVQASGEMRAVFQAFPDIFIRTDTDGRILDFKSKGFEEFSSDPISLLGTRVQSLFGEQVEEIVDNAIQEVKKTKSLFCTEYSQERDGSHSQYEARFASLLENQVIIIIRDITERKYFEEALEEQRSFLRQVIDVNPNFIFAKDRNGRFTLVNKAVAEVYGTTVADLIGKTDSEFNHKKDEVKNFRDDDAQVLDSCQEKFIPEEIITDSLGNIRYLQTVKRPILDSNGFARQILGVSTDITERKNTEKENTLLELKLRQAQKMEAIGRLAGGIAHDFNNILFSILGYSQLAIRKTAKNKSVKNELDQVILAASRARELVQQILAFSRMSEKKVLSVDMNSIVREVQHLLRGSLPSNIEIQTDLYEGPMTFLADPTQLHQVLMNLCTNAFHAMKENGGNLFISTTREIVMEKRALSVGELQSGDYVKLRVKDTGHGMTNEVKEHIFDPFFTTKEVGEGTGLGLSVIHGVVNDHDGSVMVETGPGQGATFDIYFPFFESAESLVAVQEYNQTTGSERVLVVDDETPLVELTRQMLEELGYFVVTSTSPIEALELFKSSPSSFDLIITDQTMPHMKGVTLAQEILQLRSEIPIIICTGYSEKFTPQQALEVGCKECLMKPVQLNHFAAVVRRVLDNVRKAQA